ncbi:MAG: hypothetical protein ACP5DC_10855, partial [Halothiobacillaceae bacterium]
MAAKSRQEQWLGLHDRIETLWLAEEVARLDLTGRARWQKDLHPEEASPLISSHLANELAHLVLALREADAGEWQRQLAALKEALAA